MPLLAATSAFGLGRRRWSSPQQCYLHCLCIYYKEPIQTEQVCVRPPSSALNATLPAFAAERRHLLHGAPRPQLSIDSSCLLPLVVVALTLLVRRQEGHPTCKKLLVAGCWVLLLLMMMLMTMTIRSPVPPRPQDGTVSVIVLFTIVSSCVTDCNCNL